MRRFLAVMTAVAVGLALAGPASAAPKGKAAPAKAAAAGPYKLDAKGMCHAANGAFVAKSMCSAPAAAKKQQCKDAKGKFAKCGTPGAKPI